MKIVCVARVLAPSATLVADVGKRDDVYVCGSQVALTWSATSCRRWWLSGVLVTGGRGYGERCEWYQKREGIKWNPVHKVSTTRRERFARDEEEGGEVVRFKAATMF